MKSTRRQLLALNPNSWRNLNVEVKRHFHGKSLDEALKENILSIFVAIPICLFPSENTTQTIEFIRECLAKINAMVDAILTLGPRINFTVYLEPKNETILEVWERELQQWKTNYPNDALSMLAAEKIMLIGKWRQTEAWQSAKQTFDRTFPANADEIIELKNLDRVNYKTRYPTANDDGVDEHVYHCAIDCISWHVPKRADSSYQLNVLMYPNSLSELIKFTNKPTNADRLGYQSGSLIRLINKFEIVNKLELELPPSSDNPQPAIYSQFKLDGCPTEWGKFAATLIHSGMTPEEAGSLTANLMKEYDFTLRVGIKFFPISTPPAPREPFIWNGNELSDLIVPLLDWGFNEKTISTVIAEQILKSGIKRTTRSNKNEWNKLLEDIASSLKSKGIATDLVKNIIDNITQEFIILQSPRHVKPAPMSLRLFSPLQPTTRQRSESHLETTNCPP